MTIDEALQNIDIVVAAVKMNRQEHDALRQSVALVANRCKRVDDLEKEIKRMKEGVPRPEKKEKDK
jgi:hypothetical protein